MPTYQYECSACNHAFETLQSMTDSRLTKCPECGQNTLDRLIGAGSGIIFKGSGFYETDYKRKEPGRNAGTSGASSVSTSSGASGESSLKDQSSDSKKETNKEKTSPEKSSGKD